MENECTDLSIKDKNNINISNLGKIIPKFAESTKSIEEHNSDIEREWREEAQQKETNFVKELGKNKTKIVFHPLIKYRPYIKILDVIVGLEGEEHKNDIRLLHQQNVSAHISQRNFKFDKYETDPRIHGTFIIPSGHGKGEIKNATKVCNEKSNLIELTTYDPEQLIGKIIDRKIPKITKEEKKEGKTLEKKASEFFPNEEIKAVTPDGTAYIVAKGFLANDILQLDEAKFLLCSKEPNYQQCRSYICIATDTFKKNLVTKKNIDNLSNEIVSYYPFCIIQLFLQDYFVPKDIITSGFLRRTVIAYTKDRHLVPKIENKYSEPLDKTKYLEEYKNHLGRIKSYEVKILKEDIKLLRETFLKYHKALIYYGLNYSNNGFFYTKLIVWTLGEELLKYTMNICYDLLHPNLKPEHIDLAFYELIQDFTRKLDFIDDRIKGDLNEDIKWKGATGRNQDCLEYLFNSKTFSRETSQISVKAFQEWVAQRFNLTKNKQDGDCREARNIISKLRKNNWIENAQVGQHDSRVWLSFIPEDFEDGKDGQGGNAIELYNNIYENINAILERLPPLPSLPPLEVTEERV